MKPVKVGVIGCGVIGSRHLSIATEAPQIELVAAADLIEENRQRAAERFNPPKLYATGEELLNDDEIEAVVLAFPTQHRTEMALRAFDKGKHVLIEKPIAMNAAEVRQLIAARGELTSACCSSRKRFTESARIATDIIARGKLGELRTVYCRAIISAKGQPETPRPAWRLIKALNGGGILVNWGCYDIDYLLGITGWQLNRRLRSRRRGRCRRCLNHTLPPAPTRRRTTPRSFGVKAVPLSAWNAANTRLRTRMTIGASSAQKAPSPSTWVAGIPNELSTTRRQPSTAWIPNACR